VKAVGVIGYKKSGKTTLVIGLSQELSRMGYSVAILKHVSGNIDFPHTDTSKFRAHAAFVSAISSKESEIILKGRKRIETELACAHQANRLVRAYSALFLL